MPEQVQILDERTISTPLPNGQFVQSVELTYVAVGLPPRRVYIPLENDTPDARRKAVKIDLERAKLTRPTLLDIP